jgi:hypothetical protein
MIAHGLRRAESLGGFNALVELLAVGRRPGPGMEKGTSLVVWAHLLTDHDDALPAFQP